MFKIKKWQIAVIAIFIIGVPPLLMTIDEACSPINNSICKHWLAFQWETVLAGCLGLMGGIFVIVSTRQHIIAQREDMAAVKLEQIDTLYHRITGVIDAAEKHSKEAKRVFSTDNTAEHRRVREEWAKIRASANWGALSQTIGNNYTFPLRLREAAQLAARNSGGLSILVYDQENPNKTVERIQKVIEFAKPFVHDLRIERDKEAKILMAR